MKTTIGQSIKKIREKSKMTQSELADKIGTSRPNVSSMEAGNENLCIETLMKIAKALNKELIIKFK